MRRPIPAVTSPSATPRERLAELASHLGEVHAAECCADLLGGADLHDYPDVLPYLGGRAAAAVLDDTQPWGWARVWAARGLLYVWTDSAASVVVNGLSDRSWRAAENCLKVTTLREVATAGPGAVALAAHRLGRVRAQAVRALGVVGDTEHVSVVRTAMDDADPMVRSAAERSLSRLIARLDLPDSRP